MKLLLPLLLVTIGADVPTDVRFPEAVEVFHCVFDRRWDDNFDRWPDGWTRRRGQGFPHYVEIKISDEPSVAGDQCLRIDLNGGAAAAYSPAVAVGPLFSYVLEGYVKTEGLQYDRAHFSITLLDEKRQRLESFYSQEIGRSDGWTKLRLGPISPRSDDVRLAVLGLHVRPGDREDLRGTVLFDDVWLGRLPRMALSTSHAFNFFTDVARVEIDCTASGYLDEDLIVVFELQDVHGKQLARMERPLQTRPAPNDGELSLEDFSEQPAGLIGKAQWKPPIPGPGLYRVRAMMKGRSTQAHQRELTLVVVEPHRSPPGGEFGWTLPDGDHPLPLPILTQVISQAGINWVKYPLWYEDRGSEQAVERLIAFGERLGSQGIELIGLLCDPPESLASRYGRSKSLLRVADIFTPDPQVWYPSLEPVFTRLATRIHWWQLGNDTDVSFVGYPGLYGKIAQIKSQLDQIGQDVNLGIGWGWMNALPQTSGSELPWRSLSLSADPPMTHLELADYLDGSSDTKLQRWVVIQPLPADEYSPEVRATDLVRRMIAAKIHAADAIFCPQPFCTRQGLMNDDGTPGELYLPWRTAALALGGSEYLGSIRLPGGSRNLIFSRADDAVMVVWNDRPAEEVLYLGENVRQVDLWGRSEQPQMQGHRQVIRTGRLPTFVTGLSEPITRWRRDFRFEKERLPSVFGRPHANSFTLKNPFPRGAGGKATLLTPEIWTARPKTVLFRLAQEEELQQGFEITFPYNASSGRQPIRVDFEVQADQSYRFSIYRHIEVGLGDVYFEITTRLTERGDLEVTQRLVNESDGRVSFRCQLFAPDRRRLKTQIIGRGRGRDVKVYRLPDGEQLIGKTLWLRAEEIDGPRSLNYRVVAEP